ncbi:SH3 domain-containing protein Dlish-like [Haliotis rubra]|uniref:SH3 domain-containing protein Dlish-like n=1 Tax=Haliotis rubra TaxID=36100 RepID=UPI001EE524FF|nr:SH3 domain-containing protein Dlish-like [Haliotis rubra]XP_046577220.1 SH3 domain-containing protein Dlish-like [Haliotis rubra]
MAFLCPSRLGGGKEKRKKKEREPLFGRITGSDSVDTLVRVGMEKQHGLCPESKMVAVQGFTACADRELSLDLGQAVYVLYKENGWAYVLTEDNREGFVPLSYIAACGGSRAGRAISPPLHDVPELLETRETDPLSLVVESECLSRNTIFVYRKQSYGRYVVVFDFDTSEENDLSVERCELVTVINMEDPDWYWVVRSTGEEGFVPRSYLCPFPADLAFKEEIPGTMSAASSHSWD